MAVLLGGAALLAVAAVLGRPVAAARPLLLAVALGLLTGVPLAVERRALRRRLRRLPAQPDPRRVVVPAGRRHADAWLALGRGEDAAAVAGLGGDEDADAEHLRALVAAAAGRVAATRGHVAAALRSGAPRQVAAEAGLLLVRAGRFGPGLALVEAAGEPTLSATLADALRTAGRLREAEAVLDGRAGPASVDADQRDVGLQQQHAGGGEPHAEHQVRPADGSAAGTAIRAQARSHPADEGDGDDAHAARDQDDRGHPQQTADQVAHRPPG